MNITVKALLCLLIIYCCFWTPAAYCQSAKCGFDRVIREAERRNPFFSDTLNAVRAGKRGESRAAMKTVSGEPPVIPVVFHIILTQAQLAEIGDTAGVRRRIDSQLTVINRDFNGENPDTSAIPAAFREVFGYAGIRFGLAHTAPDGSASPGFEYVPTTRMGFDMEGGYQSGFGFSSAKHAEAGGADAWDTDSYLNIWIINTLENGAATNVLGLCVPSYVATAENRIGREERGVVLHYKAFGKRSGVGDKYITGSDMGRTLTHELGHYFNLLHVWGDDEGKCPASGGLDDGIADTPPQAYPSSGCYIYPKTDGCSRTAPGIMFMNYMDYSFDRCLLLFTQIQARRMQSTLQPGADAYALSQHPWLLSYPADADKLQNSYTIYPNPANGNIFINFRQPAIGLKGLFVTDPAGRVVLRQEYSYQSGFYPLDIKALSAGIYILVLDFEDGQKTEKILVY